MTFDAWGSYNSVTYPENADGERYRVDYVYDEDRRTDVASVVDSHDLVRHGGVRHRRDGDASGWTPTATRPRTPTTASAGWPASARRTSRRTRQPTVAYTYAPTAPGYAYALAEHRDRFASSRPRRPRGQPRRCRTPSTRSPSSTASAG